MKAKVIRDYIDNQFDLGYSINLLDEEISCIEDYENFCNVVGTRNDAIISSLFGYEIDITKFDSLFSGHFSIDPTLVVYYEYDKGDDEYRHIIESMSINTLEIKKLDIKIY